MSKVQGGGGGKPVVCSPVVLRRTAARGSQKPVSGQCGWTVPAVFQGSNLGSSQTGQTGKRVQWRGDWVSFEAACISRVISLIGLDT